MKNHALRNAQRKSDLVAPARLGDAAIQALELLPPCCTRSGFVYLVEGGGLVKIGLSMYNLPRRMRGLQSMSPIDLRLLAIGRGIEAEALFHTVFTRSRRHGEWFTGSTVKSWLAEQPEHVCVTCAMLAWNPVNPAAHQAAKEG